MKFKIGDRVIFSINSRGYVVGAANPLQGTRWACEGTVDRVDYNIGVMWDNGAHNSYTEGSLELIRELSDPNRLFAIKKRAGK